MNNLTKFNTIAEYNDFLNSNDCPYVNTSYIGQTDEVKYFKDDLHENTYFNMPFTIEILSIGQDEPNCKFFIGTNSEYLRYKINNGEWTVFNTGDVYLQIDNIVVGDKIQVISKTKRANNSEPALGELDIWRTGSWDDRIGGNIKIYGNVMSIIIGDDYLSNLDIKELDLPATDAGYFTNFIDKGRAKDILVDAENLWLPTRQLTKNCFQDMFKGCEALVKGPNILAKELPEHACSSMFDGCISLTHMPIILAEKVSNESCAYMFANCSNLVNVTPLHINKCTSSVWEPVAYMFVGCTSLTTTPVWNETITLTGGGENSTITDMFKDCTSLIDASPIHITLHCEKENVPCENVFNGLFSGCTSLVTGPYLSLENKGGGANTGGIFDNCENLESFTFLYSSNEFDLGIRDVNHKNGVWYYKGGVDYNPADYVPDTWTTEIYSGE